MMTFQIVGTLLVIAVLAWIVVSILRLPRPATSCSRCTLHKSVACWRVDCPFHEDDGRPR